MYQRAPSLSTNESTGRLSEAVISNHGPPSLWPVALVPRSPDNIYRRFSCRWWNCRQAPATTKHDSINWTRSVAGVTSNNPTVDREFVKNLFCRSSYWLKSCCYCESDVSNYNNYGLLWIIFLLLLLLFERASEYIRLVLLTLSGLTFHLNFACLPLLCDSSFERCFSKKVLL